MSCTSTGRHLKVGGRGQLFIEALIYSIVQIAPISYSFSMHRMFWNTLALQARSLSPGQGCASEGSCHTGHPLHPGQCPSGQCCTRRGSYRPHWESLKEMKKWWSGVWVSHVCVMCNTPMGMCASSPQPGSKTNTITIYLSITLKSSGECESTCKSQCWEHGRLAVSYFFNAGISGIHFAWYSVLNIPM